MKVSSSSSRKEANLKERAYADNLEASMNQLSLRELEDDKNTSSINSEVESCCIVVNGFPSAAPPHAKENMLSRYYQSGGKSKWLGGATVDSCDLVLIAYSSSRKAASALQATHPTLKACMLNEFEFRDASLRSEIESAAVALVRSFKPDIDSRVANRMIGAALGIKIRPAARHKTRQEKTTTASPVMDAWDS
eukprot:CAMPEP_0185032478 /NCGR_PEP_ID=MMETSP1103-20130426/20586_1 /TAXON_ID=36769 /ORGANISM="Paraphysomonas bandaiensis, Strain Caron Lab Isolate" /LENGTH=192 /DNA_ID=CAMNT_0027568397 /DNA_START=44 /DNA_END=622 /DNA_ORIENTATION=+